TARGGGRWPGGGIGGAHDSARLGEAPTADRRRGAQTLGSFFHILWADDGRTRRLRILLIEDNADARDMLKRASSSLATGSPTVPRASSVRSRTGRTSPSSTSACRGSTASPSRASC